MSIFNLLTEREVLDIYDFIDKSTVKNIYKIEELQSDTNNEYNLKNVTRDGKIFNNNFNNKAEFINFIDNRKFVKFYIPLNIYCEDDKFKSKLNLRSKFNTNLKDNDNKLITAYERGMTYRDIIEVYVNGIKVPDKSVLLTVYQGTTDVYFESSILSEVNNEVCFIIRNINRSKRYLNYTFSGSELNGYNLNKEYSLYINGIYQTPEEYSIENGNLTCAGMEDDVCELILEHNRIFKTTTSKEIYSNIFNLHNLCDKDGILLDTINQPLTKNNIYIYIDGYKVCNDDIDALNGSFFQLKDYSIKENINIFIIYKLEENPLQKNKRFMKYFYRDKYSKINNLYNLDLITRHLIGKNYTLHSIFPKWFNFSNMKFDFPPFYVENLIKNPLNLATSRKDFAKNAISTYIKYNNHYIFNFAYLFRNPEEEVYNLLIDSEEDLDKYIIKKGTPIPSPYIESFNEDRLLLIYKDDDDYHIEKIKINDKILSRDMYDAVHIQNTKIVHFYIKTEALPANGFKLNMIIERGTIDRCRISSIFTNKTEKSYPINMDKIKLKKLRLDLVSFYIEEGFRKVFLEYDKDYTVDTDLNLNIINEDILGKEIKYMNPFFSYRNDLVIKENFVSNTLRTINLKSITNEFYTSAICPNSENLEIYYNGYRLLHNIDYFVIYPTLYNNVTECKILFNIAINTGNKFVFVFRERRENTHNIQNEITSKYGLVYLQNCILPASKQYMDFYINNTKTDVTVYTNDLIKLNNNSSNRYFGIINNVDLPRHILEYLKILSDFNIDSFENFIKELLKTEGNMDDLFEKFKDFDTDNDLMIPSDDPINVPKLDLRLDYLYEHFLLGNIDKKIDCGKGIRLYDVLYNEIFNYFNSDIISLNANNTLKKYEATMDSLENCYTILSISEIFGKVSKSADEYNDGEIDNIYFHPIYKYIYEENDIILDANKETVNMYECDANNDVEAIVFDSNEF